MHEMHGKFCCMFIDLRIKKSKYLTLKSLLCCHIFVFYFRSVLLVPQKSRSKEISGGWNWWLPGLQVGRPLFPPWTSWWKCRGKVTKGEGKMGLGTRKQKQLLVLVVVMISKLQGALAWNSWRFSRQKTVLNWLLNSGAWNWRYSLAPVSKCVSEKLGKPVTFLKASRSFFYGPFFGGKCLGKCDLDYFFWRSMNLEMTNQTICFLLFWCFGRGISYGIGHLDQTYTKYNTMVCTTIWILHTIHAAYVSSIQCINMYIIISYHYIYTYFV